MPSEEQELTLEAPVQETKNGLVRNLRTVGLATLLSRLLGLARDISMATLFGAGTTLDVFIVAFRLPNLTRQLFGEGALTTAFLPVFIREQTERSSAAARATLTSVAIALASFLSLIVILSEAMIAWALFSFELSESFTLMLQLLAIMLPYMIFICCAALISAALHALKVFLWPALVPVVLNVIWLTGVLIAFMVTQDENLRIRIVAITITVAGVFQCLLPFYMLHRMKMGLSRNWRTGWAKVSEVILTMLPVVAGLAVIQVNVILDSIMAWGLAVPEGGGVAPSASLGIEGFLSAGTATGLYIGQRMYQFPLGVFGIALGTVLFPLLTQHAQSGEIAALRKDLSKGLRLTIAIALPASAGLFLLASPLTNLLFRHGEFTQEDSMLTANMIATYGCGVWAYIGLTVLNRAFYATGDRMTPMRLGVIALVFNLIMNIALVIPLKGVGLALGSVLAAATQLTLTTWKINQQIGSLHWDEIRRTLIQTLIATATMVVACLTVLSTLDFGDTMASRFLELMLPLIAGAFSYWFVAKLLGMSEVEELLKRERG
ncbi:murein biosynthesis integral membrane protein MurJ [bacterium]|jgi:putative peptidoglycan lipid II flippase|nr:murein biosynthesis integral membrane protein MurJ [Planctomicrobium sp.]MDA7527687.1 murein biosynthesis integral membrane protein MurJ [bacterium]MDB4802480.1 murein biosynthesis integral membrane protein MurJ [bacterium]